MFDDLFGFNGNSDDTDEDVVIHEIDIDEDDADDIFIIEDVQADFSFVKIDDDESIDMRELLELDDDDLNELDRIGSDAESTFWDDLKTISFGGWCTQQCCAGNNTGSWCLSGTTIGA